MIGASFIGLEVAASLRARNIEVHVVAPEACPMEHILGREVGQIVGSLEARDCTVSYWLGGRKLAVAIVHRDLEGLRAEVEFERRMAAKDAPE